MTTIPLITDPMGQAWHQPPLDTIELDDTHALMSACTFAQLNDYSGTMPTGVYPGKMWKRHDGIYDSNFLRGGGKPVWLLMWYGESEKGPDFCSIHSREILLP